MGSNPMIGGGGGSPKAELIGQQQRGLSTYMANMAKDPNSMLYQLSTGQMTPYQQEMMKNQLAAVDAGQLGAEQQITNTVREGASARGLFSSRGAIADEASQLANLPLQKSLQLSGIYQNMAGLQQQGILSGMGMRGNLLSGAIGGYGQAANSYLGAANQQAGQNQMGMQGAMGMAQLILPFLGL